MGTFTKIAKGNKEIICDMKDATINRAGGISFNINDPSVKLITMTGGSFFAEPRYYSEENCTCSRNEKLESRIKIIDDNLKNIVYSEELDDVSREILDTIWNVLNSENPKDALCIANWLRNELNIRLTPQIILVLASRHPATQKYVREYCKKVIVRPDEIKTCLLAHRYFFGNKTIKNCLSYGLGDALSKFNERSLMKYDGEDFPKWKDVIRWIKRMDNWPLSKELARYFTHGETDKEKTPIAYKRKLLSDKVEFDSEAKSLVMDSLANWEVVLSKFGTSDDSKREVWSFLIDNNLVGYMALLRNVRNILKCNVDMSIIEKVANKLSDKEEVKNSRQLPFRFSMAYEMIKSQEFSDQLKKNKILEAVENASNISADNVSVIPGLTAVFADNSGSMSSPVSAKSKMSCSGAANILCGIIAKRSENAYVFAFGTDVAPVTCTKNDTVIGIAGQVRGADTKGMSTNTHKCLQWLCKRNIYPDRIIILSDMQCWNDSQYDYNSKASFQSDWQKYKSNSMAKKTWLHCVHLNGYGDNIANPEDKKVNLVSGFSEKILDMLLKTEGISNIEAKNISTIEQIRSKF